VPVAAHEPNLAATDERERAKSVQLQLREPVGMVERVSRRSGIGRIAGKRRTSGAYYRRTWLGKERIGARSCTRLVARGLLPSGGEGGVMTDGRNYESGRIGYLVLYLMGVPVGLLLLLWVLAGNNIFGPG